MFAKGRAPARMRRGNALYFGRKRPSLPPANETARGRRAAARSALGALGAAALAVLGVSAAGTELVRPAAANAPTHPSLVFGFSLPAAGTVTAEPVPAAFMPAMPGRVRLVFSLSDVVSEDLRWPSAEAWTLASVPLPPAEPREAARQEVAAVSDGLNGTPVPVVIRRAPADSQPALTPAPVMKPPVETRAAPDGAVPRVVPKPRRPSVSVSAMIAGFESFGYDLDRVRAAARPVPRLYLEELPRDLANVASVAVKKRLFVQAVLPIILRVNEEIVTARWRAERLGDGLLWEGALSASDRKWLIGEAEYYGTAPFDVPELLKRMDIVPPSLALAQAAEETGWGTSRFAREGNALFGQYTYKSVTGMIPQRRDADSRHRVRRHDSLLDAVRAYVHNLNTHWAYEDFRDRRALLRRADRPIGGHDLAGALGQYSERRAAYIESIRTIMRQNRLEDFDRAWLNNRQWTALIGLPGDRPL